MNGIDKLFIINLWRRTQGLEEWPVPGVVGFPKPIQLDLHQIIERNKLRTRSNYLRSIPILEAMFNDKELEKQRDKGYLMGYFRYENPNSLDYKPKGKINREYCINRSLEKWIMFEEDHNLTYVVDIINLIELWFVGQTFDLYTDGIKSMIWLYDINCIGALIDYSAEPEDLITVLLLLYNDIWKHRNENDNMYLEWDDSGRPEQGLGA